MLSTFIYSQKMNIFSYMPALSFVPIAFNEQYNEN